MYQKSTIIFVRYVNSYICNDIFDEKRVSGWICSWKIKSLSKKK